MNLESLKNRLQLYLEAERAILTGQEYTIGNRSLKRPDLAEVQHTIDDLAAEIDLIENPSGRRKPVVF